LRNLHAHSAQTLDSHLHFGAPTQDIYKVMETHVLSTFFACCTIVFYEHRKMLVDPRLARCTKQLLSASHLAKNIFCANAHLSPCVIDILEQHAAFVCRTQLSPSWDKQYDCAHRSCQCKSSLQLFLVCPISDDPTAKSLILLWATDPTASYGWHLWPKERVGRKNIPSIMHLLVDKVEVLDKVHGRVEQRSILVGKA
jgi:hypothetical protein